MKAGFLDPVYFALTRPINCRNGHNNGGNRESAVIFHCVLTLKKKMCLEIPKKRSLVKHKIKKMKIFSKNHRFGVE